MVVEQERERLLGCKATLLTLLEKVRFDLDAAVFFMCTPSHPRREMLPDRLLEFGLPEPPPSPVRVLTFLTLAYKGLFMSTVREETQKEGKGMGGDSEGGEGHGRRLRRRGGKGAERGVVHICFPGDHPVWDPYTRGRPCDRDARLVHVLGHRSRRPQGTEAGVYRTGVFRWRIRVPGRTVPTRRPSLIFPLFESGLGSGRRRFGFR